MKNNLIVIENGQLNTYVLDDRLSWEIGRPSKDNKVDIKLFSATVSRKHGTIQNMDGIWFYLDHNGKNGTMYNHKHIKVGINGRIKPIMLEHGDTFIFGVGEGATAHNCKPVWAMFSTCGYDERWRVVDTKGVTKLTFTDDDGSTGMENPEMGTVVERSQGMAIYMGDTTYLVGNINLSGY